jgi:hypothetical protein
MKTEVVIREPGFYCYRDEEHFFGWLKSIPGIEGMSGVSAGLSIVINDQHMDEDAWADFIGLLARYAVDMSNLEKVLSPKNEGWIRNPSRYGYSMIFGDGG